MTHTYRVHIKYERVRVTYIIDNSTNIEQSIRTLYQVVHKSVVLQIS